MSQPRKKAQQVYMNSGRTGFWEASQKHIANCEEMIFCKILKGEGITSADFGQ